MMIRTVLAVVLATVLLGASLPVIDDARRDHSESVLRTELDRVEQSATNLLETDDPSSSGAARRVVTLTLPTESWTDAGVANVTFYSTRSGSHSRITWTIRGGKQRARHLQDLPLRTASDEPLVLRSAGRHRLVLALDGTGSDPVVTVQRFTSDNGTSRSHARVAIEPT